MPKYKNVSDQKLVIPGVGEVESGAEIESATELHNSNLELVGAAQQPAQNPLPPAHPSAPAANAAPTHGSREETQ